MMAAPNAKLPLPVDKLPIYDHVPVSRIIEESSFESGWIFDRDTGNLSVRTERSMSTFAKDS